NLLHGGDATALFTDQVYALTQVGVRCEGSLENELGNLLPGTRPQQRSGRACIWKWDRSGSSCECHTGEV
ncbi:Uncharacterized protein APZ42_010504, partial [Daphnia magna]